MTRETANPAHDDYMIAEHDFLGNGTPVSEFHSAKAASKRVEGLPDASRFEQSNVRDVVV